VAKYGSFPLNDSVDDIWWNDNGEQEVYNGSGDFYDWMDIVSINVTGNDIIVEFQGAGSRSGSYWTFAIVLDTNNDLYCDFLIMYSTSAGGYVLQNQLSGSPYNGYTWTGSYWITFLVHFPFIDSGLYLNLTTIGTGLAECGYTLSNLKVRAYVFYSDSSTFTYADFVPEANVGGDIPGFQMVSLLFAILTLTALISLERNKRK
jgi:hypothetical protein